MHCLSGMRSAHALYVRLSGMRNTMHWDPVGWDSGKPLCCRGHEALLIATREEPDGVDFGVDFLDGVENLFRRGERVLNQGSGRQIIRSAQAGLHDPIWRRNRGGGNLPLNRSSPLRPGWIAAHGCSTEGRGCATALSQLAPAQLE